MSDPTISVVFAVAWHATRGADCRWGIVSSWITGPSSERQYFQARAQTYAVETVALVAAPPNEGWRNHQASACTANPADMTDEDHFRTRHFEMGEPVSDDYHVTR